MRSAKTPAALDRVTKNLTAFVREHNDINLADVAYTLQVGRKAFSHRRIIFCREDALTALEGRDLQRVLTSLQGGSGEPSIALLFMADDSVYAGLGRSLCEDDPLFRDRFDECAELLKQSSGTDLCGALDASQTTRRATNTPDVAASLSQPALFAIQYALRQVLIEMGVRPATFMGPRCRRVRGGVLCRSVYAGGCTGCGSRERTGLPRLFPGEFPDELLQELQQVLLEVGTGRAPEIPWKARARPKPFFGREIIIRALGHLWLA